MELVVLESPYGSEDASTVRANVDYARLCVFDCLRRKEAPFASHLLYTQPGILDDSEPQERELGITAGFEWGGKAERVVVYIDRGISSGMRKGIEFYSSLGIPIEFRRLNQEEGK